jgi:hypothetical protein
MLMFALSRVAAVARLVRQEPQLWDDHCDGEIAFLPAAFDPARDELRAEQIDWSPMIPPPEAMAESVSLDEAEITQLSKLKQAKGFHLELDVAYSPAIAVAGVNHPRFPKLAMAVDRASGFIGGFHLSEETDRDGAAALGLVLHKTLTQLDARPEVICVQRPRVAAMLQKVATELNIPVMAVRELKQLNAAKANMEGYFGGR